jgi:hypothetical protein
MSSIGDEALNPTIFSSRIIPVLDPAHATSLPVMVKSTVGQRVLHMGSFLSKTFTNTLAGALSPQPRS